MNTFILFVTFSFVQEIVVKLNSCIGHLKPPDVNIGKEIIRESGHLATVDDEIGDLVASESLDCVLKHLGVLDVFTIGDHFDV